MKGISIIIPITNRANLLDKTLASYNINISNYEILVLSRNSTDNLKEVIAKYSNLNIKLIEYQYGNESWINPAHAFNWGAKLAKYNIIALTSPEIKHESKIIDILSKGFKEDAILCKTMDEKPNKTLVELYSKNDRGDNPGFYFFGAYKKDKFLEIGGIDEDFMDGVGWEDLEFGDRWLRNGFNHTVSDMICIHQYHPRSHQTQASYKANEQLYLTKGTQMVANKKVKICGFMQVYNEMLTGHLPRVIQNFKEFCDYIVVFDDASTDGSAEYCEKKGCYVVRGTKNNFINETSNKQILLEKANEKYKDIDWFFWLDADEVLEVRGVHEIRNLCRRGKYEGYSFPEITLWRSDCWMRKDYLGNGRFIRLWKNKPELKFNIKTGLHNQLYPNGINSILDTGYQVIHYGYAKKKFIEDRWVQRTKLGVPKDIRIKGIQEQNMVLELVPDNIFPEYCKPVRREKPKPITYDVN